MLRLGDNTNRGENIALNNYGTVAAAYQFGCALDGTACRGSTDSIATVAAAEHQFMMSAGHRAAILGTYDRFGCGSGTAATGVELLRVPVQQWRPGGDDGGARRHRRRQPTRSRRGSPGSPA